MAILSIQRGETATITISADGASDFLQIVGKDLRGLMFTSYGTFSATAVVLKGSLLQDATSSSSHASWKTINADISGGVQEMTEPWSALFASTSGYSSGTLTLLVKAY